MKNFQDLIREICDEKNIDVEFLSKDWIMKLTKNDKIKYIVGMYFPINNYASTVLCNDKYATYNVLFKQRIPIVEHKLMYSKRIKTYHSDLERNHDIKKYLKKHGEVVIKDNCGRSGIDVYRATRYIQVKKRLRQIFKRKNTALICPFLKIEAEYRVIYFKGNVELIFEKERKNAEWKHNLSRGATAKIVTDEGIKKQLSEFAMHVASIIDVDFASVDLIRVDGKLMVLEVNSSVSLEKFMEQVEKGRNIAKEIYSKAIEDMFQ